MTVEGQSGPAGGSSCFRFYSLLTMFYTELARCQRPSQPKVKFNARYQVKQITARYSESPKRPGTAPTPKVNRGINKRLKQDPRAFNQEPYRKTTNSTRHTRTHKKRKNMTSTRETRNSQDTDMTDTGRPRTAQDRT